MSTWRYRCPGKSWFWSRSAEEVLQRNPADHECCRTGSGWHGESQSHHRTLSPPGKHTHIHPLINVILHWTSFFLFSPSMFSLLCLPSQTVCRGCGRHWWGWYDTMFFIQKAEDFSSHGRCDLQPPGSTARRLSSVSPLENSTSSKPDQCNHNKN